LSFLFKKNKMHCVYILYSKKLKKTYIGETKSIIDRFKSHNQLATKGWTLRGRPWVVIHVEFYDNRSLALKREKQLKGGQGRQWIKNEILCLSYIQKLISA